MALQALGGQLTESGSARLRWCRAGRPRRQQAVLRVHDLNPPWMECGSAGLAPRVDRLDGSPPCSRIDQRTSASRRSSESMVSMSRMRGAQDRAPGVSTSPIQ